MAGIVLLWLNYAIVLKINKGRVENAITQFSSNDY